MCCKERSESQRGLHLAEHSQCNDAMPRAESVADMEFSKNERSHPEPSTSRLCRKNQGSDSTPRWHSSERTVCVTTRYRILVQNKASNHNGPAANVGI